MYLFALLILIIVIIYSAVIGQPFVSALNLFDIPSLMIITFITMPMLLASGLLGDLKRAFKVIMVKKVTYTKVELQRSLEAVKLTIKLIMFSGIFGFLIGLIQILKFVYSNLQALGPNLSVNLVIIFYALFGCFILLPIQSKLKVLILSTSEEK